MKRKKILVLSWIVSILLANSAYCSEFIAKVGTFNYSRILKESEAGKAAIKKIQDKAKELERTYKNKTAEIEEMKNQLKTEAPILSQQVRTERQQDLLRRMSSLQAFRNQSQLELKKLQNDNYTRIRWDIQEIAGKIGKEQDFFLILDDRNIFHAQHRTDLTERLIQKYNKAYLKKKATTK